ncbi:hypothetical protein PHLCEN_2v6109 [Hermanssonia centrifuga]|uniref:Tc1-like transposase DDE domain-containing protein n=1 Tax=Hermanssonia centrifuga TaxID=98765 RepID=A0A2R6P0F1_9APHY|nr:hypothetical protein PHLCEN_2v6109 [Hermanssonia centrifuga]
MPKNTPCEGRNWFVEVINRDDHGQPRVGPNGKLLKKKIEMAPGTLPNGTSQDLYFRDGPQAGVFKGMVTILEERGYTDVAHLRAECPKFNCDSSVERCCCRRLLYNQPDFSNQKSRLELLCEKQGFQVLFLPKFHPELNFIEQCWGHAKRVYRMNPPSSKEEDLERNMLNALASVGLEQMRRYARRSRRFMDAYMKGLSGKQAAWAIKKYHGHRVVSENILEEVDAAGM